MKPSPHATPSRRLPYLLHCLILVLLTLPAVRAIAQTEERPDDLPASELEKVYESYRLENVTQAEAEALFGSAVAAVYYPERNEVRLLSSDGLAFARTYLGTKAQQQLRATGVWLPPQPFRLDAKVAEAGSARLGAFLSSVEREAAVASRVTREQFISKTPYRKPPLVGLTFEPPKRPSPDEQSGETTIHESFEGDVWSSWSRADNTGGQYAWEVRGCTSYSGNYAANAPRGGVLGASLACSASYPPNLELHMYRQFCATVQPSWLAYLELMFAASLTQGQAGDTFGVLVEGTGGLYGWVFQGNWSTRWYELVFNLRQWPVLGDLTENTCNNIHLVFESDAVTTGAGWGAAVDELFFRYGDTVSSRECSIVANPSSGGAPLTVLFRPATDMYSPHLFWDFDDGSTSEALDPAHTFYSPGDYVVTAWLWDGWSGCSTAKTIRVSEGTCTYQVSPAEASFTANGGGGSIAITASAPACAWQAVSNAAWITVTSGATGAGNGTVSYSVAGNSSTSPRTGTLTVAGKTFTVTQAGFTCSYSIWPTSFALEANGGSGSVTVSAAPGCAWSSASQASWLTVTSGQTGTGNGSVSFAAAANQSTSSRSGTITIGGQTLTVTQSGAPCSYLVSPASIDAPASGGTWPLTLSTGPSCAWSLVSAPAWVHVTPTGGSGNASLSLVVDPNPGGHRTGSALIQGQSVVVAQQGVSATCTNSYWVPVVSHAPGANSSQWRTDLGLLNRGTDDAAIELTLYSAGTPLSRQLALAPWGQTITSDVSNWISYGFSGTGALRVCSNQPVAVTSRTYNLVPAYAACYPGGTFGQFYAAFEIHETLAQGEVAWLPGLTENSLSRCNIGIVNTGTSAATVRITLRDMLGVDLATYDVFLSPGQLKQENRPFFTKAGHTDLAQAYAKIEVVAGSGIVAYASVVDNKTNDPVTIPMEE